MKHLLSTAAFLFAALLGSGASAGLISDMDDRGSGGWNMFSNVDWKPVLQDWRADISCMWSVAQDEAQGGGFVWRDAADSMFKSCNSGGLLSLLQDLKQERFDSDLLEEKYLVDTATQETVKVDTVDLSAPSPFLLILSGLTALMLCRRRHRLAA